MDIKIRKSPRIPGYDYSTVNYYFVTICCHEKKCLFGQPHCLNKNGRIAYEMLMQAGSHYSGIYVDKFVIMPNHIHAIIVISDEDHAQSINTVVGLYKSGVTREIRKIHPNLQIWQRSFHDRIIRCQAEYEKIWYYIDTNPQRWGDDCFFTDHKETGREGQDPPLLRR